MELVQIMVRIMKLLCFLAQLINEVADWSFTFYKSIRIKCLRSIIFLMDEAGSPIMYASSKLILLNDLTISLGTSIYGIKGVSIKSIP